jgi:hypothetical protein
LYLQWSENKSSHTVTVTGGGSERYAQKYKHKIYIVWYSEYVVQRTKELESIIKS